MEIVENDIMKAASLLGQLLVDPHLRRQVYHRHPNFALPGCLYSLGDVPRVTGGEAAHNDDHLPASMGRHVLQRGEDEFKGVLEGRLSAALARCEAFQDLFNQLRGATLPSFTVTSVCFLGLPVISDTFSARLLLVVTIPSW